GGEGHAVLALGLPEQEAAAVPAEAAVGGGAGAEPLQPFVLGDAEGRMRGRRGGPEMAGLLAALGAMAIDHRAQRRSGLERHRAAEAGAAMDHFAPSNTVASSGTSQSSSALVKAAGLLLSRSRTPSN